MRIVTTFILSLFTTIVLSQVKQLETLPAYDCSLKKVMAIIGKPTVLVSPDNSTGLDAILDDYCATLGENCIRKKESDLVESDWSKNLFLVGVLSEFKKWRLYQTPIRISGKGFVINGKSFLQPSDGFAFVDTNKIIISGNSLAAIKTTQLALTGGHDILVTQNGKITYFGNSKENAFDWFNLQDLKKTNYKQIPSALFSSIYISKTFTDTIDYAQLNQSLKEYAKQFLSIYDLKMPAKKIVWFLHSNMQEYGTMSGMFGLTCPGNNSAGFSIRGEIHTNGYNPGLVKHEYSHYLFDNSIPQDNNPAFFVEGCVEYVTNINDKALFTKRISIAKKFRDSLNYSDLIVNNKDFYGKYSAENYSICGIFVKFIIDKFGVNRFKQYCLAGNKTVTTKEIFDTGFADIVSQYKGWLDKQ